MHGKHPRKPRTGGVSSVAPDIRGFELLLFDNLPGVSLLSFTPPANLDQGERISGPSSFGVGGWSLGNVRAGKSYTLQVTVHVPNPFGVPFGHKSSWHLFADVPQPEGCAGCGGLSASVTIAEPTLDGPTPGSGAVTFSVAESSFSWAATRQIQRVVRYAPTTPSRLDTLQPDAAGVGHEVTLSARLRRGGTVVAGEPVTFTVGSQGCVGTTTADGTAACTVTLDQPGGATTLTATYAGTVDYYPSSAMRPFTIVSYEFLCERARALVTKAGVADSLCAKLAAAERAAARGDTVAAANIREAFVNEVEAQRGTSLTDADAALLIRFVRLL